MGSQALAWPRKWADAAVSAQAEIERLIAWIRLAVTVGIAMVVVVPPRPGSYQTAATGAAMLALTYGIGGLILLYHGSSSTRSLGRVTSRRFALIDTVLTLLLVAVTGAGGSLLLGVAMLVTIEVAMRFTLRETVVLAALIACGMAAVIMLVPEPALGLQERIQSAIWWVGLLGWSAAMVSALARLLVEEQRERARLATQQAAERNEFAREREQRRRLEELEQDRREFLEVLHHELRTPTASMEALSRAVVRQQDLDVGQRERMIDLIQSHAHHLTALLDELRAVAVAGRAGSGGQGSRTDVSAAELVHLAAHAAGIDDDRLEVHIDEPLAVVRIDAEKVRRVLINLLENARRHSPEGETVTVRLGLDADRMILTVRDRGPGVAPAQARRMFDKFVSHGERRGTSGLGLWIVGELVKAMGGQVRADDHPDGGLSVTVDLPASGAGEVTPDRPQVVRR